MYEENLKNENRNKKIKYLTKMEKAKKKEKQKRQPYVYKPPTNIFLKYKGEEFLFVKL